MDKRVDIVAYLHIGYGLFILFVALLVVLGVVGGGLLSGDASAIAITSGVGAFVGVIMLILAVPSLVAGYGLLKRREWGRILVIVLSLFDLFSFPIGTAIGAYSLYVLFQDEVKVEFR